MKGVPEGYHNVTPYLMVPDADEAVSFYQRAFGAVVLYRSIDGEGVVRNVQIRIGDSPVMLGIRAQGVVEQTMDGLPLASIYLFVEDADATFKQAVASGATALYPPQDMDYGNREGGVVDPFHITWWIATHLTEDAASS